MNYENMTKAQLIEELENIPVEVVELDDFVNDFYDLSHRLRVFKDELERRI